MAVMNPKKSEEEEEEEGRQMLTDVTDEEMALRYGLAETHQLPLPPFMASAYFQVRELNWEHQDKVCEETAGSSRRCSGPEPQ